MELVKTSADPTLKVLALRGAVRLLKVSGAGTPELLSDYAVLMNNAPSADEKRPVLSGLAQIRDVEALNLVLRQFSDDSVKAEALQAAIAIAKNLGATAREDAGIFQWQGSHRMARRSEVLAL